MNVPNPSKPSARRASWTRYWASGALHSCATSYARNYEGPLAAYWIDCFAALAAHAAVLDLATGNGPLPQFLLAHCAAAGVQCDAVDLADIAPSWPAHLPAEQRHRLRFHAGMGAEALHFGDCSFDLVTSQYGLEYADLDLALPEVARVLRPGGALRCVIHHADSLPVMLAKEELQHIEWLLEGNGLLLRAHAMVEPLTRASTPKGRAGLIDDMAANAVRERFNACQDEVDRRIGGSHCPDVLGEARVAVSSALGVAAQGHSEDAYAQLGNYREALGDCALRLRELRACAQDASGIAWLGARLRALDVEVESAPLADQRGLHGWTLQGQKKGA